MKCASAIACAFLPLPVAARCEHGLPAQRGDIGKQADAWKPVAPKR